MSLVDRLEWWLPRILAFAVVVMLGVGLWLWYDTSREFDPFTYRPDPRPIERIEASGLVTVPTIEGFDGPAVRIGETVPTTGLICSTASGPVDASGNLWWTIPKTNVRIQTANNAPSIEPIQPGCTALRFENDIPAEVANLTRERGPLQWVIAGDTRPTRSGGVAATFRIEPVWIIPDRAGGSGG